MFTVSLPSGLAAAQRGTTQLTLPYNHLCQDSRVKLAGLMSAVGQVGWERWQHSPLSHTSADGVMPILSRVVIEASDASVEMGSNLRADGGYLVAHGPTPKPEDRRLYLNMYADVWGNSGRSHGERPDNAGSSVRIGRILTEHIFTRPFGPPGERPAERVLQEVRDGLISPEAAAEHYGVIIDRQTMQVRDEETRRVRASLARER